jgi:3-deoxy-D-manno-octulosonate 8-phosphate phosphatase (KDO 8-P phosphatase)
MNDITTFIFDVDGVRFGFCNEGDMHRTMNIKDGYAMKAAVDSGYNVCIIWWK